jgi:hypothetical protein
MFHTKGDVHHQYYGWNVMVALLSLKLVLYNTSLLVPSFTSNMMDTVLQLSRNYCQRGLCVC